MAEIYLDSYGHEVAAVGVTALTAGAVATSAAGTISPTNSAGTASTVTSVKGTDRAGSFVLTTSTTSLAAGQQVLVRFAQPYAAIPSAVIVTAVDTTDVTASLTVGANAVTAAGFDIVGTLPVTGKAYTIHYLVIP